MSLVFMQERGTGVNPRAVISYLGVSYLGGWRGEMGRARLQFDILTFLLALPGLVHF